ncbi:MAG TPA: TetR/AcrR family transcriptional regulator [Gammaproteobacteria bacterium]
MSRRMQILRRATEIFERQGVAQTSIEDIAKAVGVKREAIYYYFRSREEILLEIILPQSNSLILNLRGVVHQAGLSSMQKLRGAFEVHLNSFNPGYLEMSVMLREDHVFKDQRKLQELRRTWRDYDGLWVELVREGQARGEFDAGLDAKMTAFGLLGMCNWMSRWYQPGKGATIPELIDTFFRIGAHGITPLVAGDAERGRGAQPGALRSGAAQGG